MMWNASQQIKTSPSLHYSYSPPPQRGFKSLYTVWFIDLVKIISKQRIRNLAWERRSDLNEDMDNFQGAERIVIILKIEHLSCYIPLASP